MRRVGRRSKAGGGSAGGAGPGPSSMGTEPIAAMETQAKKGPELPLDQGKRTLPRASYLENSTATFH